MVSSLATAQRPEADTAADFGSPLVLSRVHWLRPELVAEVSFLTWTDDGLAASSGE
jgi:bifunctional non-homologous end joining protein LigD